MLRFFAMIRAGIKAAVVGGIDDAIEEIDRRADVGLTAIDEVPTVRIPVESNGRVTKTRSKVKK